MKNDLTLIAQQILALAWSCKSLSVCGRDTGRITDYAPTTKLQSIHAISPRQPTANPTPFALRHSASQNPSARRSHQALPSSHFPAQLTSAGGDRGQRATSPWRRPRGVWWARITINRNIADRKSKSALLPTLYSICCPQYQVCTRFLRHWVLSWWQLCQSCIWRVIENIRWRCWR